jgi:hypothetical protein
MCVCVIANTRAAAAAACKKKSGDFFSYHGRHSSKKYDLKMICWLARTCQDCCLEFRKNAIKRGKYLENVPELFICVILLGKNLAVCKYITTYSQTFVEQLLPFFVSSCKPLLDWIKFLAILDWRS